MINIDVKKLLLLGAIQTKVDSSGYKSYRLNKYHPMSYIYLAIMIPVGVLVCGVPQIYDELKNFQVFKWH